MVEIKSNAQIKWTKYTEADSSDFSCVRYYFIDFQDYSKIVIMDFIIVSIIQIKKKIDKGISL